MFDAPSSTTGGAHPLDSGLLQVTDSTGTRYFQWVAGKGWVPWVPASQR